MSRNTQPSPATAGVILLSEDTTLLINKFFKYLVNHNLKFLVYLIFPFIIIPCAVYFGLRQMLAALILGFNTISEMEKTNAK